MIEPENNPSWESLWEDLGVPEEGAAPRPTVPESSPPPRRVEQPPPAKESRRAVEATEIALSREDLV